MAQGWIGSAAARIPAARSTARRAAAAIVLAAAGLAGCVAVPVAGPPGPPLGPGPGPIDSPIYGGRPPVGPGCVAERARFALGERASGRVIDAAGRRSRASEVRIVRPGDFVTRDYRSDRLTLELDGRGRVAAVSCG
ncbi:I78 family peptidase inhibitor [Mongoliimonas terrestris]|uniref:I78 family peptidase inhibitor n=1 Tax=Mongoliimonas terrestris TaxID=1709001 RepID=UPI000B2B26B3|nr:I78 family peptidase inhibitor [Mongoliimonas terrestris]